MTLKKLVYPRKLPAPGIALKNLGRVHKRYPLTTPLTEIFGGLDIGKKTRSSRQKTHDVRSGWRTEIVSESLCDDVLKHLAPSLEPYKGCTIIDVHPGACLWSSKLHDFLKPKLHVLMEPEPRYMDEFVRPLLEKPGSKYVHSPLIGAHPTKYMENYTKLLSEGKAMPPRPPLDHNDPKLRQLDTGVLFTGNLGRNYLENRVSKNVKYVNLVLQHMATASLTNAMFHQSGLVKMLWWIPDEYKTLVMPTTTRTQRQYDHSLNLATKLVEVAGVDSPEVIGVRNVKASPRTPRLALAVRQEVQRKMADSGVKTPPGREMPIGKEAPNDELEHLEINPLDTTCTSTADLSKAIDAFSAKFTHWKATILDNRSKGTKSFTKSLDDYLDNHVQYPQVMHSVYTKRLADLVMPRKRSTVVVDLNLQQMNLEANYSAVADLHPTDPELPTLRKRILESDEEVAAVSEELDLSTSRTATLLALEDLHGFYCRPRTLERDNRDIDSLRADPEEFWPQVPLALIEMTPRERDLSVEGVADRQEGAKTCHELLVQLFQNPATPLPAQLARVAFNAATDLIPKVPAITDVRKGGRLNPMRLPVRCLTPEMSEGLVRAFLKWPFRPERWQLELLNESTAGDETPDTGETDELD